MFKLVATIGHVDRYGFNGRDNPPPDDAGGKEAVIHRIDTYAEPGYEEPFQVLIGYMLTDIGEPVELMDHEVTELRVERQF